MDGYVTKSQFAKIYGCSKPYVSQLVTARRLVLSADGKLVNVDASLKLLDVTADPSKAGVRERWQAHREGRAFEGVASDAGPAAATASTAAALPSAAADAPPTGEQLRIDDQAAAAKPTAPTATEPPPNLYRDARTLREQAEAQMAQIELAKAQGRVLEADSTIKAIVDAHVAARMEIMMMRDRLTQLVAPITDPRKVYDLITAECERACQGIQRRVNALSRAEMLA